MTSVLDTRSVPPAERRDYWSAGIAERFFPIDTPPTVRTGGSLEQAAASAAALVTSIRRRACWR